MSKIQTKRKIPAMPAPSSKRGVNNVATPTAAQAPPPQRRNAGRTAEAARVGSTAIEPAATPPRPPRQSKQTMIATMLQRKGGAAIADLMTATGWQSHSVRAALTGLRKSGQQIERQSDAAGATRYRLVSPA